MKNLLILMSGMCRSWDCRHCKAVNSDKDNRCYHCNRPKGI